MSGQRRQDTEIRSRQRQRHLQKDVSPTRRWRMTERKAVVEVSADFRLLSIAVMTLMRLY